MKSTNGMQTKRPLFSKQNKQLHDTNFHVFFEFQILTGQ
jgi:hypothetical protein